MLRSDTWFLVNINALLSPLPEGTEQYVTP